MSRIVIEMKDFFLTTGIANITWQQAVMIAISCLLLYLAIEKKFEPLLLIPISFGMLLANLPLANVGGEPVTVISLLVPEGVDPSEVYEMSQNGQFYANIQTKMPGGIMHYLSKGAKWGIFPPLIFLGIGAMTDFSPLIANPKSMLMGAAAQFGIFFTFIGALLLGFDASDASATSIIGGANGPAALFSAIILAPHLLGAIAVAAYSYMALVPVIQPPIMKLLTNDAERRIVMKQPRSVSKKERIIFPIMVTIVVSLILPAAATLVGMLMLGNVLKESVVTDRLSETASNSMINIITILLGTSVGATAVAEQFLKLETLKIVALGVVAFGVGTASGVICAKIMNKFNPKDPVNPLIGSAGVSAVPMAARVSNKLGREYDRSNFLLMHAMGPNVAGVIGSTVAAGILITMFG